MKKEKILILYEYFFPGFKAGGPVQSLVNLINLLHHQYEFMVITSGYDVNADEAYSGINLNEWNTMQLDADCSIQVWYGSKNISPKNVLLAIEQSEASVLYLNCMFSFPFFLYPVFKRKKLVKIKDSKWIISPRGVLMPNALSLKSFKKGIYIKLLSITGLLKKCSWHATSIAEVESIQTHFTKRSEIFTVGNVPKKPISEPSQNSKEKGLLRLVHLSLIAPVKNIHTLLKLLKNCVNKIELDIFGPVKDSEYWEVCVQEMQEVPVHIRINYKQDLEPQKVQSTLQNYDAMILLTTGENFGHALFESMSVGRPVITSFFTPWKNLQEQKAGWNVDISQPDKITALLDKLAETGPTIWEEYCQQAHHVAKTYFEEHQFPEKYTNLFG